MLKVHCALSLRASLLSLNFHNADSTFTVDQKKISPLPQLSLSACVLGLVINLELPNSWPAARVGGAMADWKSLVEPSDHFHRESSRDQEIPE